MSWVGFGYKLGVSWVFQMRLMFLCDGNSEVWRARERVAEIIERHRSGGSGQEGAVAAGKKERW